MKTSPALSDLLARVPDYPAQLRRLREILLANAAILSEIPAPTGGEEPRLRRLTDRFVEAGLAHVSFDEAGNASALLPGTDPRRTILVGAHADTPFTTGVDHTVNLTTEAIIGPGVADNSLGLAVLASLPDVLECLGIELGPNLILLGSANSLGRGDLQGIRFFLEHCEYPIEAGLCLEGVHLGRLSYACLGMVRGVITLEVPEITEWQHAGGAGAVVALNRLIQEMLAIPLPSEPKTRLILGSAASGTGFNTTPTHATLRFEVRSEQDGMAIRVREQIEEILAQLEAEIHIQGHLQVIAQRKLGGIGFSHPLTATARAVMEALGVEPKVLPSVGELSALIDHQIPGLTIGLTEGAQVNEFDERAQIEPLFTGLAQVVGLLQAIDQEGQS